MPNGIRESLANFKDWAANGIPTIVMHNNNALIRLARHNSKPPNIIHNIFKDVYKRQDNKYSVDNIKSLGFEIVCEKLKYGGLRRYVFIKRI